MTTGFRWTPNEVKSLVANQRKSWLDPATRRKELYLLLSASYR